MSRRSQSISATVLIAVSVQFSVPLIAAAAEGRNYAYFELEGTVEDFQFHRQWRHYYWRDDFTMLVRDDSQARLRIISREPTPWNNLRLGTTYTGLKVDWKKHPRVKIIGVKAVDRSPAEFYDLELDPKSTATAFIVRVRTSEDSAWQDYYVNNWFHRWAPETDVKMLSHYAGDGANYSVYGYLKGIAAPFDDAAQKLLAKHAPHFSGIIFHARVVKTDNAPGYELRLLHLMGRNKQTLRYGVFFGDPSKLVPLDQRKPQ